MKPLFAYANTGYTSQWTPKDVPRVSYPMALALRFVYIFGAIFKGLPSFFQFLLLKLRWCFTKCLHSTLANDFWYSYRIPHTVGYIYLELQKRVARDFEESKFDWKRIRGMPVPEYDWENGNPEEFRRLFIDSPHPVILRGFMKGTPLVRNFTFDKILERFGNEEVLMSINGNTEVG